MLSKVFLMIYHCNIIKELALKQNTIDPARSLLLKSSPEGIIHQDFDVTLKELIQDLVLPAESLGRTHVPEENSLINNY